MFIVCVCVLALSTVVTLQLRSRLQLPASSQTPAGSWQSPYGLIVCVSSRGAEPSSFSGRPQQPEGAATLGELKMTSLPAGRAQEGAELGLVPMDAAPHAARRGRPATVGVWPARGSSTKSNRFHSKLSTASEFQPTICNLSVYLCYCSPDT